MAPADLQAWVTQVRADFDRLSANLVDLDGDPTTALLAAGDLGGTSEAPARAALEAMERLWALLPLVRAQLVAVEEEQAKGRRADADRVRRLLSTAVVELYDPALPTSPRHAAAPVGPRAALTIAEAMNALVADYHCAADGVGRIGTAWREGLSRLDTGRAALSGLEQDLGPFPEANALRELLERANEAAAGDPLRLGDVLGALAHTVGAAETARRNLLARRAGLTQELESAAALLAELDRTIRNGTEALEAAEAKIANATELLAPLDPVAVLDAQPRGLAPWLARLQATAGRDWRAAVNGLVAWRSVADATLVVAGEILAANQAPLARRNELRGLLSALVAKAASTGQAEDPELSRLHGEARAVLFEAPCDLATAAAAVEAFRTALASRQVISGRKERS